MTGNSQKFAVTPKNDFLEVSEQNPAPAQSNLR